jgi:hypothetical protein
MWTSFSCLKIRSTRNDLRFHTRRKCIFKILCIFKVLLSLHTYLTKWEFYNYIHYVVSIRRKFCEWEETARKRLWSILNYCTRIIWRDWGNSGSREPVKALTLELGTFRIGRRWGNNNTATFSKITKNKNLKAMIIFIIYIVGSNELKICSVQIFRAQC